MKVFLCRSLAVLFAGLVALLSARATQATLTADAHVDSSRPAVNLGGVSNLNVGNGYTSFIQFSLSSLPAGITASQVSKATVTFYVNRVNTAGTVSVAPVTGSWTEMGITYTSAPTIGPAAGSFSASVADQFVTADVTSLIQGWIMSPSTNLGLALTTSNASLQLDSKESGQTAHPATLDVTITSMGATGAQGIQGLTGAAGAQGIQGIQGVTGAQGIQGATGAVGATGATGAQGITGATGATGAIGATGIQGATGATGAAGATGATGAASIVYRGTWNNSTFYLINDAVTLNGTSHIATANNFNIVPGTDPTVWSVLAAMGNPGVAGATGATGAIGAQGNTGATGAQGATGETGAIGATGATGSINYQRSWNLLATYSKDAVVSDAGYSNAWVSLVDNNSGHNPTTVGSTPDGYWARFVAQGVNGVNGVTGAQGATGSVASVSVTNGNTTGSASVNSSTGALTINFPSSGSGGSGTGLPDPSTFSFDTIPLTISRTFINTNAAISIPPIGPNSTTPGVVQSYVFIPQSCHGYFAVASAPGNYFDFVTTTAVGGSTTSLGTCTASAGGICKIDPGTIAAGSYVTVLATSTNGSSTANTGAHTISFACQ